MDFDKIKKIKDGVTVRELEDFAKKHRFSLIFCLAILFSCIFSFVFFGAGWSVILATIGAICGIAAPKQVDLLAHKVYHFLFEQDKTVQIILGVVVLIISIFLPPAIFFALGLHGGKSLHKNAASSIRKTQEEKKHDQDHNQKTG